MVTVKYLNNVIEADHGTTTQDADASSRSISSSQVFPGAILRLPPYRPPVTF